VNITVVNDYETFDLSIKDLLIEWIKYRRQQKRVVISHKRTTLLAEQRTNDVKIFLMNKNNLDDTIKIFRNSRNRAEIEFNLIQKYRHSEIKMDSLQARVLSNLRMHELSIESYEACIKRREELEKELAEIYKTLDEENGIDKIIIAELRDGIKRFGTPRKSNVIPYKISVHSEAEGACILQLSSDGMILRKETTNVYEEPIPTDSNGFAVRVDNDASFVIIDEYGYHSYVKVKEIPIDSEVPLNRFMKKSLEGNIVAMLPVDIDSDMCCTLISKNGMLKKIRINDMGPSKKPCIALDKDDRLVRGLVTKTRAVKDILVFTKNGYGQRMDPNDIRITSPTAKGGNGFKLKGDDEIVGCYTINPEENQYLMYMTTKGKARLNLLEYLNARDSKHDEMVRLISLNDRDRLISVIGCNKYDKAQVFFDDGSNETIEIKKIEEGTMSSDPKKVTSKNAVTTNVIKVKLI
jgi:DNA gyrase/topoisomerase IV subunit A